MNCCIFSQEEWIKIDSPTDKRIWRIQCLDSLNCWAAGDSGLIVYTSNGGVDWLLQKSNIYDNILDIFFLNENLGWAVAIEFDEPSGSYVLKTTDGGINWSHKFFDSINVYFFTVNFIDSLNGFLAGAPSYIFYRTSDGGATWHTVQFDSSVFTGLPINDLEFYSEQYGFACGGQRDVIGVIWKTTDFGITWSSYDLGPEPLTEIYIVDSLNILGVGGDYEYGAGIASSTDGGISWHYFEPGIFGVATGVSFRTKNEVWACISGEGKFLVSNDSGLNWEIRLVPDQYGINDITFTDSLHGFAVGDGGVILKYKPRTLLAINDKTNMPLTSLLLQNYPNPFNPTTRIDYQLPFDSKVTLELYGITGEKVATLINSELSAGYYTTDINASAMNLASGVYIYRITAQNSSEKNFVQVKKLILTK